MPDKILIATFSIWNSKGQTSINGMIEPLLSFFLPQSKIVDLIDGPHPGSSTVITRFDRYANGSLKKKSLSLVSILMFPLLKIININGTQILFKLRDFLTVFELFIISKTKYDLFIGLESIYTIAGIILKRLGLTKTVVYYVSDYIPNRYSQKWLNNLYLSLDRFCCYSADFIWDVSPAMFDARIKAGLDPKKSAPVILVPNALFPKQISYLPLDKIKPFTLVFAGTFGPENGLPIAILAMKRILNKFPKAKLSILGGGHTPQKELENLARDNKVEKNIIFHGFIQDANKLSNIVKESSLGIAPYMSYPDSARWYGDATKIRLYFGAGLPVITTHVPPLSREIEKYGSGIIIKDNEEDLANAVIKVFEDNNLYMRMRKEAINFAKNNTWKNSYSSALKKMGTI
ncbi:MAG: glycosyltransferase [Candidatus Levybacteria bacterium]|nr:glycosyltransferase [Candidatus Levybacteria bacterium]